MMDNPCGMFGDYSFSGFGSLVKTNRHTHRRGWTPYSCDCRLRHGV